MKFSHVIREILRGHTPAYADMIRLKKLVLSTRMSVIRIRRNEKEWNDVMTKPILDQVHRTITTSWNYCLIFCIQFY
jgi:hypothetical protein